MEQIRRIDTAQGDSSGSTEPGDTASPTSGSETTYRPPIKERRRPTPRSGAGAKPNHTSVLPGPNLPQRRPPTPRPSMMQSRGKGPLSAQGIVVLALLTLGLGIFAGVSVARRRENARQILISITPPPDNKNSVANITIGNMLYELERLPVPATDAQGRIVLDKNNHIVYHQAGEIAAEDLIVQNQRLMFFRTYGAMPKPDSVNKRFLELSKDPNFVTQLRATGQTEEEAKLLLRLDMAGQNMLTQGIHSLANPRDSAQEKIMESEKILASPILVTETEARIYWADNTYPKVDRKDPKPHQRFIIPEAVKVQVIVTSNLKSISSALAQLNSGALWSTVASQFNILPKDQYSPDGILPVIHPGDGQLDNIEGLEDRIFKLKANDQTAPIELKVAEPTGRMQATWWIIRCINHTAAQLTPYDEVKDECKLAVALDKATSDPSHHKPPRTSPRVKALQSLFEEYRKKARLYPFNVTEHPIYAAIVKTLQE